MDKKQIELVNAVAKRKMVVKWAMKMLDCESVTELKETCNTILSFIDLFEHTDDK